MQTEGIHLRGPVITDQAYIASTFVSSLGLVEDPRPSHERGMLVDRVLDKAGVRVALACEPGPGGRIIGWLAYSPMPTARVFHYCYVRNKRRKQGIANALALYAGLSDTRPAVYTLEGPSAEWLKVKYPTAAHLSIEEFLGP